jgi:glycosyltransferase involved in cell wall biosynthesis
MIVLHIVNTIRRGGAERQLATIMASESGTKNYMATFYAGKNNYLDSHIPSGRLYHIDQRRFIGRILSIRRLISRLAPDVIFAWGALPYCVAKTATLAKKVRIINGSIRHGVFNCTKQSYLRFFVLHVSRVIVANSKAGLRANKIRRGYVLYNGIDKRFDKEIYTNQDQIKSATNKLTFISVANLVPYKDYVTVFKSLSRLRQDGKDFSYYVVGDGPMRNELETAVGLYGLRDCVTFLGVVADPENYLAKSDVFIHSSRGEGCPNAILEAMHMGLPIVATDTGGTPEILGDNAILYQYRDVDALYQALLKLTENEELRTKMGDESYSIARQRFTVRRMISDYERLICAVAENNLDAITDLSYCPGFRIA